MILFGLMILVTALFSSFFVQAVMLPSYSVAMLLVVLWLISVLNISTAANDREHVRKLFLTAIGTWGFVSFIQLLISL